MTFRFYPVVLLSLTLTLGVSGCSWLVTPEQGAIKCKVEKGGKDPCPKGTSCVEEVCKNSKAPTKEDCEDGVDNDGDDLVDEHDDDISELCNHEDDDCDGKTDEGFEKKTEKCDGEDNDCDDKVDEGYDPDGDEWTICGDSSYKAGTYDCEPMLDSAHPGAKEICDGLDNDCDGNTDNAPAGTASLCAANQLCLEGRCIAKSCAIPNSGVTCKSNEQCVDGQCQPMNCSTPCAMGQFCDMTTTPFSCKDVPQQRKIGESCALNADCLSNLCIDSAALNLPETPSRVCGKTCCNDAECATNEVCFAAGTGARSCLPRTLASYTIAGGGKPCAAINECTAPQVCAVAEATQMPGGSKVTTAACRSPASLTERPVAEQCSNPLNCSTRLCQALLISSVCTTPCRITGDCTKLSEYQTLAPVHAYCQYVDYGEHSPYAMGSYGPICIAVSSFDTPPPTPKDCRTNNDCPEGTCIGASTVPARAGHCATTCCNDAQCKMTRPDARCIPVARGTRRFEMRCIE
jgi:Putative metal-binding motif